MDPLSEVLSLLNLKSYVSGGFKLGAQTGFDFQRFQGIKCYAVGSGSCWLTVQDVPDPLPLRSGDCVLLPRGLPFAMVTDLSQRRVPFEYEHAAFMPGDEALHDDAHGCSILGGHFLLAGGQVETLLSSLPAIMHIRREVDQGIMRWSLAHMRSELREPKLGGSLIAQHLALMILIQALRLYLQEEAGKNVGWLFALADAQMSIAIQSMHQDPGHPWTLQKLADRLCMSRTVFAEKFRKKVGMTPMAYLTHWRMLLAANRLRYSDVSVTTIGFSLGYGTESAFGRTFKRIHGCSPKEHRRRSEVVSDAAGAAEESQGIAMKKNEI